MRKPLVAAVLLGAMAFIPAAGHAQSLSAGKCILQGTASFDTPVKAVPTAMGFTFDGSLTCSGVSGLDIGDAPGAVTAVGNATIGCVGGTGSGAYEAAFPTGQNVDGQDTQDVWSGNFGTAGGPASGIRFTVTTIDHQHFDDVAGEWVSDGTDNTAANAGGGDLTFSVSDPAACATDGVSDVNFGGNLAYAFVI